ncbi:MAG TPA: ABC transporter permease [Patescibacteria group bacterium]|nr:ABC transporter permease [Patescibacteria group bacterium]
MQRLLYIIQKEFRQIARERVFLLVIFIMPFIQIVVLGFAITTDIRNVSMAIIDYDRSSMSRRITDAFRVTGSFRYRGVLSTEREVARRMNRDEIKLALVIPRHLERDVKRGASPAVQVLVDGVDGNTAGVALAYANRIVQDLQREWLREAGTGAGELRNIHLTEVETRMVYNPALESTNNIVPGILAMLLMTITSFLTGMSIVREKEIGTLEQLMVTPVRSTELILGKVIPLLVVAFVLLNIGILAAGLIFGLWMKGSLITLYLLSILFSMSSLGLGVFASTLANTQQQAMFVTWFFTIFSILLSGFFIPIENMPRVVQVITYLNPVRYFMVVIREIYLKGTGLDLLWKEALAMTIFGLVMFVSATVRFQKRLG